MKALLSATLVALALTLAVPALADRDRGHYYSDRKGYHKDFRKDYRNEYRKDYHKGYRKQHDRRSWQAPRHGKVYYYHPAPRKYYAAPRYSRGGDRYIIHHHHSDSDTLKVIGGLYLLNEILHHDQHHYR